VPQHKIEPAKKGSRTVYITVGIWHDRGGIHMTLGQHFHVNITRHNHYALFVALRAILRHEGRWPEDQAA